MTEPEQGVKEPEQGGEERRLHARFPLNGRAQVEFEERRYFLTENVTEASATGFFVESLQPASVGEKVSFDLRVTHEGPVCTGNGEVSWVRGEDETSLGPAGFAIEFLGVDPQGGQLLLDLSDALAKGGEAAVATRVEEAVNAWQLGGGDDALGGEGLEDTETLLKETSEMSTIQQDEIDTDPLFRAPEASEAGETDPETSPDPLPLASGGEVKSWAKDDSSDRLEAIEAPTLPISPLDDTPPTGLRFEDRDVLSKTLDVGSSRSVSELRRRDNPRKPVPIWPVLLTAGLLIGGLLWMTSPPSERSGHDQAVGPKTEAPTSEGSTDSAAPTVSDGGEDEVAGGSLLTAAESTADSSPDLFRGIQEIRWRREGSGLRVVVEFTGLLAEEGYEHFRPGNDPPREVLQVFGVLDEFEKEELQVGEPELRSIRVGHHRSADGVEDRIVFDLTSRAVRLRSVEPYSSQLHLFLELPNERDSLDLPSEGGPS